MKDPRARAESGAQGVCAGFAISEFRQQSEQKQSKSNSRQRISECESRVLRDNIAKSEHVINE